MVPVGGTGDVAEPPRSASGTPSVRPARHDDAEAVALLCQAGVDEAQTRRGGPLLVRRELDPTSRALLRPGGLQRLATDARRTVLVGTIDDVVLGVISARVEDVQGSPLGVVDFCVVDQGARGVGMGEALLQAVLSWCERLGCRGVDVPVLPGDRAAKQWLEGAGFQARALTMHRAVR
jgi:GNAT superfamily N-acetyltransferase